MCPPYVSTLCVYRCAFALEYLIGVHEQRSLRTPRAALAALGHYDPVGTTYLVRVRVGVST